MTLTLSGLAVLSALFLVLRFARYWQALKVLRGGSMPRELA